jgi:G:T/U-mismatch repair DNA glycosylase
MTIYFSASDFVFAAALALGLVSVFAFVVAFGFAAVFGLALAATLGFAGALVFFLAVTTTTGLFLFLGRLTPKVPIVILPRLVFLSPFPIIVVCLDGLNLIDFYVIIKFMFLHQHPYKPFIQKDTTKLIVGTLPPPRFSTGQLLEKDVDFCYGSYYNSLWLYIDKIHDLKLHYDNSTEAIEERQQFLIKQKIGICDIVESAERDKIDASDLGMKNIKLRNIVGYLQQHPNIDTLLFTGGNSKNGPEYFFRKHLKDYGLNLEVVSNQVPRIHQFMLPVWSGAGETSFKDEISQSLHSYRNNIRIIKTVSLISASGSANRAIGSMPLYQQLKTNNQNFTTFDFRVVQYREFIK